MRAAQHPMPFGAAVDSEGRVRFRLFAPDARRVDLLLENGGHEARTKMSTEPDGWHAFTVEGGADLRYRFLIDGDLRVPDPASRFQPEGVHGPSLVVDPSDHVWQNESWSGRPWSETVLYELHVGTFTAGGTFETAIERLEILAEMGVTALEVMPVATFAGRRGWGYDGVLPFAPHPSYGDPDAFRRFVDAAHGLGLQVLLDVVYNHFGPEGNYLNAYAKAFFTHRHRTPWGDAMNYDGDDSRPVREFAIHNALYWLEEYRLDGLRLDAVHAIVDDSTQHILDELAERVHAGPGARRHVHLVLENDANQARYLAEGTGGVRPARYVAQWNDDFHHACHTLLTGESNGYYVDYADAPIEHLDRCLREGFAWQGEPSPHRGGERRGEPSAGLPSTAFIAFLQNHDQVGNRALGERLTVLSDPPALRAMMALVLLGPAIPALFMGEEFACKRPFLYFADFEGELARAVREGRRREFASFEQFGAGAESEIPDPMALATFERSKLDWSALDEPAGAARFARCRRLLSLRHARLVPRLPARFAASLGRFGPAGFGVAWHLADDSRLTLLANLGPEPAELPPGLVPPPADSLLHADAPLLVDLPLDGTSADDNGGDGVRSPVVAPWSTLWYLEKKP